MGTISKIATSKGIIPQFADTSTYIHFFPYNFPTGIRYPTTYPATYPTTYHTSQPRQSIARQQVDA